MSGTANSKSAGASDFTYHRGRKQVSTVDAEREIEARKREARLRARMEVEARRIVSERMGLPPPEGPGSRVAKLIDPWQVRDYTAEIPLEDLKDEGDLNKALTTVLRDWGVPKEIFKETAAELERVAKARVAAATRPKWDDRDQHDDLSHLNAPRFLKQVHPDFIGPEGTVDKQTIREIDANLMASVEAYVSNRKRRDQDAGDAKGLNFVAWGRTPFKVSNLG